MAQHRQREDLDVVRDDEVAAVAAPRRRAPRDASMLAARVEAPTSSEACSRVPRITSTM